jgi:circadian clock protein KaiC
MTDNGKAIIRRLSTGVRHLDDVLGGGVPEYSFNLVAGDPGAGKTTLCHQIMFTNASRERPGLYFTILGEPPLKMLRYQQQFSFFDMAKVDESIHFVNVTEQAMDDLKGALEFMVREVERLNPGIVVVDSFRSLLRRVATDDEAGAMDLPAFIQRLTVYLTSWEATTFLVGEYSSEQTRDHPMFTVADGILWLFQSVNRNSMVRKLQVMKMRGQETQPGLHTFRITGAGLRVFPRMVKPIDATADPQPAKLTSTGVPGLDEMLGGGTLQGSAVLVGGPSGSGKSTLGIQFLAEGVRQGQPGVLAMFEETPQKYLEAAKTMGSDFKELANQGKLKLIYLRPLDLSVDETLHEIQDAADQIGAKRVVIDSLTGLEVALAPTFEQDFRESLYRLLGALTTSGITIMMTAEITESYTELRFSPHAVSFLTNDIILQRYVELEGRLETVMAVVKTRSRKHSHDLRRYDITPQGIVVGDVLSGYEGIVTGLPRRRRDEAP